MRSSQKEQLFPVGNKRDYFKCLGQLSTSVSLQNNTELLVCCNHFGVHFLNAIAPSVFLVHHVSILEVPLRKLLHNEISQSSAFADFGRLVLAKLLQNALVVGANHSLCVHDIEISVFIKHVFLMFIDVLPLVTGLFCFIHASRSLELSNLPLGLAAHLPLLLLLLYSGVAGNCLLVVFDFVLLVCFFF